MRYVLGATPEEWQAEALEKIVTPPYRLSIRSGHGVGKTTLQAWVILWFLLTRGHNTNIPVTANSQDQLRDVVWKEVSKWVNHLPEPLKQQIDVLGERVVIKGHEKDAFAVARTASKDRPEALQGFHADNILFVLEEASGIEEIVFEVAGGALSSHGAMCLMAGNPTKTSGYFYRSHHQMRDEWHTMHVSCFDSTRVDPDYPKKMAREYGEDSNTYRVRVLGEFPIEGDDAVMSLQAIEDSIGRDVVESHAAMVWGLDVARFGDDTSALAKRRGNTMKHEIKEWAKKDLMTTAAIVFKEWQETPVNERPSIINVDSIGLGAGVADRLRQLGLPAVDVNVAEAASSTSETYNRLRDELWFKGREWFESKAVKFINDAKLIAELVTPIYKLTPTGKIQVESKDEMKKRGFRSPNRADAFLLTFAGGEYNLTSNQATAAQTAYDIFGSSYGNQETSGMEDYNPW